MFVDEMKQKKRHKRESLFIIFSNESRRARSRLTARVRCKVTLRQWKARAWMRGNNKSPVGWMNSRTGRMKPGQYHTCSTSYQTRARNSLRMGLKIPQTPQHSPEMQCSLWRHCAIRNGAACFHLHSKWFPYFLLIPLNSEAQQFILLTTIFTNQYLLNSCFKYKTKYST